MVTKNHKKISPIPRLIRNLSMDYTSWQYNCFWEPLFSSRTTTAALREDPFSKVIFDGSSADGAGVLEGHFLPRITLISLLATDIEAPGVATFNSEDLSY